MVDGQQPLIGNGVAPRQMRDGNPSPVESNIPSQSGGHPSLWAANSLFEG